MKIKDYNLSKILFCGFFCLILTSCSSKKELPTINIGSALLSAGNVDISSYIKEIKYIPLETSDSCMIGEIYVINKVGDLIYISDNHDNLFVFNTNGKFIRKIGQKGRGPQEYQDILGLTVDRKNGDIYLIGMGNLYHYGKNGDFKHSSMIDGNLQVGTLDDFNNLIFIFPTRKVNPDTTNLLAICNTKGNVIKNIRSRTEDGNISVFNWIYSKEGFTYFKEELSDTLYRMGENLIPQAYLLLDLKELSFTPELFEFSALEKWVDYYRLYNMFEFKNLTIFNLQKGLMDRNITSMVYLKEPGLVGFVGDKKGVGGIIMDGVAQLPIADENKALVCLVSLDDIVENVGNIKNPDLARIAKTNTTNSNPVLSVITFK